jgi:hypothetical protein
MKADRITQKLRRKMKWTGSKMRAISFVLILMIGFCGLAVAADKILDQFEPSPAHWLQPENRGTSPSNNPPAQSSTSPRPWWVGDLITILGILVGVIIVILQLGRQHSSQLKLQRENYREQLRLKIYQQFSKLLDITVHKNIASSMYAFLIPGNIQTYRRQIKDGFSPSPLQDRTSELIKLKNETTKAIIALMFMIERYQIVEPRIDIFRIAIGVADHDMTETFRPLFSFLLRILPDEIPRPDGSLVLVNVISPSDEQVKELKMLVDAYKAASDDMASYLYDLNIELQNTLLSNLFPQKVPRRKPLDPRCKIISTEPDEIERLQKYFEEETDWGKKKKQTLQRVVSQLKSN